MGRLLALLLLAASMAGCTDSLEQTAQRIRDAGSPVVDGVYYRPANILDPEEIDIFLKLGTTEAQADALWCEVVVPAGGDGARVALWGDLGYGDMMATEVSCPQASGR